MPDVIKEPAGSVIREIRTTCIAAALGAALVLFVLVAVSGCAGAPPTGASSPGISSPGEGGSAARTEIPEPSPSSPADADTASAGTREAAVAAPVPEFMMLDAAPSSKSAAAPGTAAASAGVPAAGKPAQSGLKAGFADDNEQFNLYVKFLDQFKLTPHAELAVQERILLKVLDAAGKPVLCAPVTVEAGGLKLSSGLTYADGTFAIYPLEYVGRELGDSKIDRYHVIVSSAKGPVSLAVERSGPRIVPLTLSIPRIVPAPLPVDVLFILDTTGSMGEEIERLRSTIEIINANIAALRPKPELRFGMVLYRDREDEYVTKTVPFTADLDLFQKELDEVSAGGGGDTPEDLQAALAEAVRGMKWNSGGIRLGFIVTDAPPHLDYGQAYDYAAAARDAKAAGIKLFGIGTGGLPLEGEYVLRQVAQYTQGKYIFLTYGEAGEASGGKEGSVSHHTGANFTTDKLETVVIRFVKEEIARQSDRPLEYDESYYAAQRVQDESREDTLGKLFAQALQGLSDYSTYRLGPTTRLAVMPLAPAEGAPAGIAAQAEYLGSQLALAASGSKLFTVVERKDLQAILKELELQLSGLADEGAAAKVGKLLGADVLVSGTVFRKGDVYEVFLKLVRVETAEVLSATKAKISADLGL